VLDGPSCDVLELDDGTLVPLVADAIVSIDPAARRIEVRLEFLG
jgi:ribosomal 30S subunit maturation factor RimM